MYFHPVAENTILTSCTFSGNSADGRGEAIYIYNTEYAHHGDLSLLNSIVYDNGSSTEVGIEDDGAFSSLTLKIGYSNVDGPVYNDGGNVTWLGGTIDLPPLFMDALGPDGIAGTGDDNLHLGNGSPCIDAGENSSVAADTHDYDGDGNTTEKIPFDLDIHPRFFDDPGMADTGSGSPTGCTPTKRITSAAM